MFSTQLKRYIIILATFNLWFAHDFNLVMSKILSFGKGLNNFFCLKPVLKTRQTCINSQHQLTKRNVISKWKISRITLVYHILICLFRYISFVGLLSSNATSHWPNHTMQETKLEIETTSDWLNHRV